MAADASARPTVGNSAFCLASRRASLAYSAKRQEVWKWRAKIRALSWNRSN